MSDSATTPRRRLVASSAGGWLIVCGLVLLVWPAATIRVIVVLVALGALGFGVSELSRVFAGGGSAPDLWAGMVALAGIFGGVVVLVAGLVSPGAARVVVGLYWLVAGLVEVGAALARHDGRIERFSIGVLSLAAGAAALLPAVPGGVLVWLAGAWLVLAGLVVLVLGRVAAPGAPAPS